MNRSVRRKMATEKKKIEARLEKAKDWSRDQPMLSGRNICYELAKIVQTQVDTAV